MNVTGSEMREREGIFLGCGSLQIEAGCCPPYYGARATGDESDGQCQKGGWTGTIFFWKVVTICCLLIDYLLVISLMPE